MPDPTTLPTRTVSATNVREVLGAADRAQGTTATWVLEVTALTGTSPSAAIKGRVSGGPTADSAGTALPYRKDGASVVAGTAITTTGIYHVPADGLDVIVEFAAGTSVSFVARPVRASVA